MRPGFEIERVRVARNIPVWKMCWIMGLTSEREYHDIVCGRVRPTNLQMIMLIDALHCAFSSIRPVVPPPRNNRGS